MTHSADIPRIAILVSTENAWGRRLIQGILSYINEVGPWHIWIRERDQENLHALPPGLKVDGLIARVASKEQAETIKATGLPVVNVADSPVEGFSAPCIRTDDAIATKMAVEHFVDRGLHELAIAGPLEMPNPAWYARSFQRQVAEAELNCHTFTMKGDEADRPTDLVNWLKSLPKPIGILVWGHSYARTVVDGCLEAEISVPHDAAILSGGYDDLLSRACFPPLSGILTPTEQIGYQAARMVHAMLRGEKIPHTTTYIPPRGIIEHLSTDTLATKDEKLLQVIEFIRDHAFEPITTADILKAVPMARRSLERRFQSEFGRSTTDEIRRVRIDRARKLLAETDMSMQEIAEACGYATYNYLSHVFKQTAGVTPRDYRKRFRAPHHP